MRVAYLGNHQPDLPAGVKPWSTETHIAASFELLGHEVTRIQEGATRAVDIPELVKGHDVFVWTQTYGLAVTGGTIDERTQMLDSLRAMGIPSVGMHLDRWFDLEREDQLATEPFFRVDHLFTADGGNQERFAARGINHTWMPPAVFEQECGQGFLTRPYLCEVAFVGSHRGGYHHESPHRAELIDWLRRTYRARVKFWPAGRQIRGAELANVYASAKVIVGDSCLVGTGHNARYISDRIPETLGRGGFLLHPFVEGVMPDLYEPSVHLGCWAAGNWKGLKELIDYYIEHPAERFVIANAGMEHVMAKHTYTVRCKEVLDAVMARI